MKTLTEGGWVRRVISETHTVERETDRSLGPQFAPGETVFRKTEWVFEAANGMTFKRTRWTRNGIVTRCSEDRV